MPRVVSFLVLVAIVLLVGSLFFQVMVQFILPLFLAAILVVIFKPLHQWVLSKTGDRPKVAAGLTTLAILLIVLLPMCGILWNAYVEGLSFAGELKALSFEDLWHGIQSKADKPLGWLASAGIDHEKQQEMLDAGLTKLQELAVPLAVGGMKMVFSMLVSLAIMMLAVYYFFADGPSMVSTIMRLSPLDDKYELELLDEFGNISRAVVVATLLSAVVQGLLAGVGYYFAGIGPVFFLTGLTMLLAMVPFVGAAAIWVPTCAWLYVFGTGGSGAISTIVAASAGGLDAAGASGGNPTAAIVLAIYCGVFVSASDNLVKPWVLHGQTNIHPLFALLSVLGGAQALGPIGILVGPMIVALLQSLLNMLQLELANFGTDKITLGSKQEETSKEETKLPDGESKPTSQALPDKQQEAPAKKSKKRSRNRRKK